MGEGVGFFNRTQACHCVVREAKICEPARDVFVSLSFRFVETAVVSGKPEEVNRLDGDQLNPASKLGRSACHKRTEQI